MDKNLALRILLFFLVVSILAVSVAFFFGEASLPSLPSYLPTNASPENKITVIIDAGHGGEDGGASSAAGLVEKDVNLEISFYLRDMLRANGINVIMTREDDRLLYDRNVDYKGRKKKLDLKARLDVAENTPNAIFVSIHLNSYPQSKYSGLEVWYSPNNPLSLTLADTIHRNNQAILQPNNKRKAKMASSSIFLLDKATCPAVLVECGFLTNPAEAELLESSEYRQQLAFVIFSSIVDYLNNTDQ